MNKELLAAFIAARRGDHNGPDLLDHWSADLETQINVAVDAGDPVPGKRNTWTDGLDEWHHWRSPRNADSDPLPPWPLGEPILTHAEAIGSTGWNWKARESRWVGFDFDAITGHAAGVGVSVDELEKVKAAAAGIPYVEARRSTGGGGLHLYVRFEAGIATANHTQHAALARAVLGMMSRDAGFDFAAQIDGCGGNIWFWHRRATKENRGFELIKAAERKLGPSDLPANWRDNVDVVSRKRIKIKPPGDADEDIFDSLASARSPVALDAEHRRIIDALNKSGFQTIWVPDFHCLHTKTLALKRVHAELGLAGIFETLCEGRNPAEPNCYCFPLAGGGFRVYRFGKGVREAQTWNRDESNTWCDYNVKADLAAAARANGGIEDEREGWFFKDGYGAIKTAALLGERVDLPNGPMNWWDDRHGKLKQADGRLIISLLVRPGDRDLPDFINKRGWWVRILGAVAERETVTDYDNVLRALVSATGESAGYVVRSKTHSWDRQPASNVKFVLQHLGHSKTEAETIMGAAVAERWQVVCLPFQPEYPGGRRWNLDAPQLAFAPAERDAPHPHWDLIFDHAGQSLTPALKGLAWANTAGIRTGADYLRALFACIIRAPFEPTPYMFFHGPENSGKSIIGEAAELLLTRGVVKADRALTNRNDFNGELAGAIICIVEEKDISKTPGALNKIKDYVTSRTLSIRKMRTDSYSQPNTTHWFQFSNDADAVPIFPGDTRITSIYVPALMAAEIPKALLLERLTTEAPAFLRTITDLTLPPVIGRLRLPVVETEDKQKAAEANRSPLDEFLTVCYPTPGARVLFSDFFDAFQSWLSAEERGAWTKRRVTRALPYPVGHGPGNRVFIGNLSMEQMTPDDDTPWKRHNGKLCH